MAIQSKRSSKRDIKKERMDFVVGSPHSGTTLLANILGHHREIYVPKVESNIFTFYETENLNQLEKDRISFFLNERDRANKNIVVEKTPKHLFIIPKIERTFKSSKFICITRNGFDVAGSFTKRYGYYCDGVQCWHDSVDVIKKVIHKNNFHLVFFEDLVFYTEDTLKKITDFLEIEFDKDCLEYYKNPTYWFNMNSMKPGTGEDGIEHLNLRNYQVNQPIDVNQIGTYKKRLTEGQKNELLNNEKFIDTMKYLGYTV